ncbi:PAS domain S-box protein [Trichocoleus sp. FACHB-591]|uniref:response regulator n=1 Tax=Trichocoleus sp. FACHB-591 TaxID=2692872 RepID=UPI001689114C|nr:response regulator [Trichocoleus sp. FACHB-591]MBD2097950.1 PAS domain S-box protein [Trichocoleus sp. FACHB-591]
MTRILIIDDNPDDRLLVKRELHREFQDVELQEVATAAQFTQALATDTFDLVVTDYQLGWNNGVAIAQAIKARYPDCPVIMFTNSGNEEVAVAAMKAGVEDYILKSPKHTFRLAIAVRSALEHAIERRKSAQLQQQLQSLLVRLNVGVFRASADGHLLESNSAFQKILKLPHTTAALTLNWQELFCHHADYLEFQQWLQASSRYYEREVQLCSQGSRIWALLSATLSQSADGKAFIDGLLEDITPYKQAAIVLEETNQTLQALIQASPLGITMLDPEGRVQLWNPAAEKIFGWSASEVLGQPLPSIPVDKQAEFLQNLQTTLAGQLLSGFETYRQRKDGTSIFIDLWTAVLRDDKGQPNSVVSLMSDVSERKRAEVERLKLLEREQTARAAAEAAEQRFRDLVNGLDAIVWEAEAKTWQFTFVSQQAETMLGYPIDRWLEDTNFWPSLIHPDDRDRVRQICQTAATTRQNQDFEYRAIAADGRVIWLRDIVYVVTDASGQAQQLRGVMVETTERRRAVSALQFLAEASTVLVSSLDYEATLTSMAQLTIPTLADFCTIDMVEEGETLRRLAIAHRDPAQAQMMKEQLQQYPPNLTKPHPAFTALRTGKSVLIPEISSGFLAEIAQDAKHLAVLQRLAGRSLMCVPLVARERVLGVISLIRVDSTRPYQPADLNLAEDLARRASAAVDNAQLYQATQTANRMKDEFLAIVSHELRSPLNAILGWSRLLRNRNFDPATTERALETIERNAKLQTQLIEDLLDVSRVMRGQIKLQMRQLDLVPVVEAAFDAARPLLEAKSIQLQLTFDQPNSFILGDSDRLQQVIWNLLSNAIKFTPPAGHITMHLRHCETTVEIEIADTGQGISPMFLPHVFDHFRQADSTTTRSFGGLGLGLAIVRHLVELHGGQVKAASPGIGQGATFTVRLPRSLGPIPGTVLPSVTLAGPAITLPSTPNLNNLRILVVDDDADTREFLMTALMQQGAEVKAVGSSPAALAMRQQWQPQVLVSDIGMPGEDGYVLIRQWRAAEATQGRNIPAIALTAYAQAEDRQQALAAGFQHHLSKPVNLAELINLIVSLVS